MDHRKFPSLGGVAVAKRLTGWSVAFLHRLEKTTPALRATPPKEGNSVGWFVTFLHPLRKPPRRLRRHPS